MIRWLYKQEKTALLTWQVMIATHLKQYTHDNASTAIMLTPPIMVRALNVLKISTAKEML